MRSLRRTSYAFSANVARPLGNAMRNLTRMGLVAGAVFGALGAKAVAGTAQFADAMDKMSRRTGMNTEELSRYSHAMNLIGGDVDKFEKGVRRMQSFIDDVKHGLTTATDATDALGLSFEDLDSKTPERQLMTFLEAIEKIQDVSQRSAIVQDIFGARSGTQFLSLIKDGTVSMKAMKAEADRLGIVVGPEQAYGAAEFKDELERVKGAMRGLSLAAINFNGVTAVLRRATQALVDMRESGRVERLTAEMKKLGDRTYSTATRFGQAWSAMSEAERDNVQFQIAMIGSVVVAYKVGLLTPIGRVLMALATQSTIAFGVMAVAMTAFGLFVAGWKIGKAIEDSFGFPQQMIKATALFEALANMYPALVIQRKIKGVGFKEQFANIKRDYADAMQGAELPDVKLKAGKTFGEALKEQFSMKTLGKEALGLLPDELVNFVTSIQKMPGANLPTLPSLPEQLQLPLANEELNEALGTMERTRNIMAPFRGVVLGFLKDPRGTVAPLTNQRADEDKSGREQVKKQEETNTILRGIASSKPGELAFS